jgi:hypothetical protein
VTIGMFPEGTDQTAAALAMARIAGCNCDPEVRRPPRRDRRAGIDAVTVSHDDRCRLLARLERRN